MIKRIQWHRISSEGYGGFMFVIGDEDSSQENECSFKFAKCVAENSGLRLKRQVDSGECSYAEWSLPNGT